MGTVEVEEKIHGLGSKADRRVDRRVDPWAVAEWESSEVDLIRREGRKGLVQGGREVSQRGRPLGPVDVTRK